MNKSGSPLALVPVSVLVCLFLCRFCESSGSDMHIEAVTLPEFRLNGAEARAHTQGLEIVGNQFYVTARQERPLPRRALLLRTQPDASRWSIWDITPVIEASGRGDFDHPGGCQSDGKRLWIPVAQSRPRSRSLVQAFRIASLVEGHAPELESQFLVEDHIGAVAIVPERDWLLGAAWDTDAVYLWDLTQINPQLPLGVAPIKKRWAGAALAERGLGAGANRVAVQDWKMLNGVLFASGLWPAQAGTIRSHWIVFTNFTAPTFQRSVVELPLFRGVELGREAMAIGGDQAYFLPEDLGNSNRIFRVRIPDLLKSVWQKPAQ